MYTRSFRIFTCVRYTGISSKYVVHSAILKLNDASRKILTSRVSQDRGDIRMDENEENNNM